MDNRWNDSDRENEVPGENVSVPLCPPQIPRGLTCDQIRTAVEGRTRRTGFRRPVYAEIKRRSELGCTEGDESCTVNCGDVNGRGCPLRTFFSMPYSTLWPATKPRILIATESCTMNCGDVNARGCPHRTFFSIPYSPLGPATKPIMLVATQN